MFLAEETLEELVLVPRDGQAVHAAAIRQTLLGRHRGAWTVRGQCVGSDSKQSKSEKV